MFDLSIAIKQWCNNLYQSKQISSLDIAELRDHLETDIANLVSHGWAEREAFNIAIEKLGAIEEISQEYDKNQPFFHLGNIPWRVVPLSLTGIFSIYVLFALQTIPFVILNIDAFASLPPSIDSIVGLLLIPFAFVLPALLVGIGMNGLSRCLKSQTILGTSTAVAAIFQTRVTDFIPANPEWDAIAVVGFKLSVFAVGFTCLWLVIATALTFTSHHSYFMRCRHTTI